MNKMNIYILLLIHKDMYSKTKDNAFDDMYCIVLYCIVHKL